MWYNPKGDGRSTEKIFFKKVLTNLYKYDIIPDGSVHGSTEIAAQIKKTPKVLSEK